MTPQKIKNGKYDKGEDFEDSDDPRHRGNTYCEYDQFGIGTELFLLKQHIMGNDLDTCDIHTSNFKDVKF